jgi:hypothetical protein
VLYSLPVCPALLGLLGYQTFNALLPQYSTQKNPWRLEVLHIKEAFPLPNTSLFPESTAFAQLYVVKTPSPLPCSAGGNACTFQWSHMPQGESHPRMADREPENSAIGIG